MDKAVARFRAMLSAEETRSTGVVRMRIARHLAETLLHGVSEAQYCFNRYCVRCVRGAVLLY